MLHIVGLDLSNVVTFSNVSVDFQSGLTYVRGINKDADPVRPTGNGAGKSRLFSAIPNVFFSAAPLALKKKSRKGMLRGKGSSIGLVFRPSDDGPEYEIIQQANGYKIYQDGNDLEVNTIPRAEEMIANLFPVPEIDFYSRCYLSTQRPYRLLCDSDADRLKHIIAIGGLDQHSRLHRYFLDRAGSIKDSEIRLSVLEQQRLSLRQKFKACSSSITEEQYKASKKNYDRASRVLKEKQERRYDLVSRQQALSSLLTLEKELDELRGKYTFRKPPAKQLRILQREKRDAELWARYDTLCASVKEDERVIGAKLRKLRQQLPEGDIDQSRDLEKQLRGLTEQLRKAKEDERSIRNLEDELQDLHAKADSLINDEHVEVRAGYDYQEDLAAARTQLRLNKLLDAHEGDDSCVCPTCQSEVDLRIVRKLVDRAKRDVQAIEKKIQLQKTLAEIESLESELKDLRRRAKPGVVKELSAQVGALEKQIEARDEAKELLVEIDSYTKQLDRLQSPPKPECDRPQHDSEYFEDNIALCHDIERHLKAKEAILNNYEEYSSYRSAASVEEEIADVAERLGEESKAIRQLESRIAKWSTDIQAFETHLNTVKIYTQELNQVEAEIAKLTPLVRDKKLTTLLVKAYGSKGLRAYAADSFCRLYEQNLNHFRDTIFTEPFEFKVEASDTGVSILVDRNNGKSDSVSDARELSGAESEAFSLLSAAALIALTPDSRKLNMIVLDEPTSHMHAVTRELFNQKFLPLLLELVPSVYVITPHDDDRSPNSSEWVVQKHKGVSVLKTP